MDKAIQKVDGLDDWGNLYFLNGLEALLHSIQHVKGIHFVGKITLYNLVLNSLVNRLRFVQWSKQHAISSQKLKPPIIITGLSRSGTTNLHRLLVINKRLYAFPLWELLSPFEFPDPLQKRKYLARIKILLKNLILPELDAKHYTRATTQEECILLLANSFHSQLFIDVAPLPEYQDWYMTSSRETPYLEYSLQLKILQSFHPEHRFVLKAPNHLGNLDMLQKYIPDAILIQTHRKPQECADSLTSLRLSLYKMVTHYFKEKEINRMAVELFESEMMRNMSFHQQNPERVISVSYQKLIEEPKSIVKDIYRRSNVDFDENDEENLDNYIATHTQGKYGSHRYQRISESTQIEAIREYEDLFSTYL